MAGVKLVEMPNDQLVKLFVEISIEQADALEINDVRAFKRLYKKLESVRKTLRARGIESRRTLVPLLDYPRPTSPYFIHRTGQVRLNAAKELLAVVPEKARATLEDLAARGPMAQSGNAGMCLQFLDDGVFKPT
jgi:hypothetical protein